MKKSKVWILSLVVCLLVMMLLSGCGGQQAEVVEEESEEIVIGIYLPMTGANAAGGQMSMEGINLALEQK